MFKGNVALRTLVVAGLATPALIALCAQTAWAQPATTCVKATKVGRHHTGSYTNSACTVSSPTHEGKYEKLVYLTPEQESKLTALLAHVNVVEKGVGGKPTVQFSGANVQVVNGEGKTASTNGEGNLVIGYDENPGERAQTGSHDLVLGEEQSFTSFGGLAAGLGNTLSGEYGSVTGGVANTASGKYSSVTGGIGNTASGSESWVSGGGGNKATGIGSSVSGGEFNEAAVLTSSISGGVSNYAGGLAWVGGGSKNRAEGGVSAIFGGKELKTTNSYEAIP